MRNWNIKFKLFAWTLVLLASFAIWGCAKRTSQTPSPETEYRHPPIVRPDEENTPERQAAEELIQQGITALKADEVEQAEFHFQEAIRIAPSLGAAYYWLARAKYDLDQMTKAWDLLDKAELLIGHDARWLERIDHLRAAISEYNQR